jgi:acetoin utilization deacetylase AcuC-like enzyme
MKIKTCFSPRYYADTPAASMRKLPIVAHEVEKLGYAELVDPGTIDPAILRKLHLPEYVDSFLTGEGYLATSQGWPWTEEIREGVLAIQAGQLVAAQNAFTHGIAANIAQGFHHAGYRCGSGYCTFNGLALVAQELPAKKVFVLDCDEHGGNGTADFTQRLSNLFNFTINGTKFSCLDNERSICKTLPRITKKFELYLKALQEGFATIERWRPDIIIYEAGADPHIHDPLGSLGMTTEQMLQRDRTVFTFCRKSRIPVFFVLAGGYQEPIETELLPLHANTFRAAFEAYQD